MRTTMAGTGHLSGSEVGICSPSPSFNPGTLAHVSCCPQASPAALSHIFGTIHDWFLTTRAFPEPVVELRWVRSGGDRPHSPSHPWRVHPPGMAVCARQHAHRSSHLDSMRVMPPTPPNTAMQPQAV